ncbi:ATP-binding protein [Streptomyces melanogenes]|uniref:ATP-binding protein n=1 Tax=Streptomyces melanogenes TaxID=67326 RepID=UPI00167DCE73|nr:ATP-binding protein [Streptomyces melanogenes]
MSSGRDLTVEGDAIGQFITGDRNEVYSVVVNATHSTVTVLAPDRRPKPVRKERIERRPSRGGLPLGREVELASILRSVAADEPAEVHGAEGIGKSALVRQACLEFGGRDGVIFLNGHGREVDDLIQSIFEACYSSPGYRPAEGELLSLLGDLRVCVVIDDLEVSARDLTRLQDAVPAGTVVFSGRERLLWGHGTSLALGGLPREAALQLLARELRRPLRPAEIAAANALWKASQGHPFTLLRAAALAKPDTDTGLLKLPAVSEMPVLLRQAIERSSGDARQALALLAAVPGVDVTLEVLALLTADSGAFDAARAAVGTLVELGLVTLTDEHVRLGDAVAQDLPDDLALDADRLAETVRRLTAWASTRRAQPVSVADHSPLIAALIEAASRMGRPDLGVALAHAAAPAVACSLRWGAWDRILTRGLAAAKRAQDAPAHAYFTHETGIRLRLTGHHIAAAAALAAAAAAWHALGDHGSSAIAEHAHALLGSGPSPASPPAAGTPGGPHASTGGGGDPTGGQASSPGQGAQHVSHGSGNSSGTHGPAQGSSSGHAAPGHSSAAGGHGLNAGHGVGHGALAKVPLVAKVVIGAALLGGVGGAGVYVWGEGNGPQAASTVPLHVRVATDLFEVKDMPGTPEGPCPSGAGTTDCTKVTRVAKGKRGPVEVVPAAPLPRGVSIVYWGCDEGASAATCTVTADRERTVCATTTSSRDASARQQCQQATSRQNPTQKIALVHVHLAAENFQITATPDTPGAKPCVQPPLDWRLTGEAARKAAEQRMCEFVVPLGTKMALAAKIEGKSFVGQPFNGEPIWFGCDESPTETLAPSPGVGETDPETGRHTFPNATTTCTLNLTTGRYIGLASTDLDDTGGAGALASAFATIPRAYIAPGVRAMPTGDASPLQRVPCSSTGGPADLECLGNPPNGGN